MKASTSACWADEVGHNGVDADDNDCGHRDDNDAVATSPALRDAVSLAEKALRDVLKHTTTDDDDESHQLDSLASLLAAASDFRNEKGGCDDDGATGALKNVFSRAEQTLDDALRPAGLMAASASPPRNVTAAAMMESRVSSDNDDGSANSAHRGFVAAAHADDDDGNKGEDDHGAMEALQNAAAAAADPTLHDSLLRDAGASMSNLRRIEETLDDFLRDLRKEETTQEGEDATMITSDCDEDDTDDEYASNDGGEEEVAAVLDDCYGELDIGMSKEDVEALLHDEEMAAMNARGSADLGGSWQHSSSLGEPFRCDTDHMHSFANDCGLSCSDEEDGTMIAPPSAPTEGEWQDNSGAGKEVETGILATATNATVRESATKKRRRSSTASVASLAASVATETLHEDEDAMTTPKSADSGGSWRCDTAFMHSFANECKRGSDDEKAMMTTAPSSAPEHKDGQVVQQNQGAAAATAAQRRGSWRCNTPLGSDSGVAPSTESRNNCNAGSNDEGGEDDDDVATSSALQDIVTRAEQTLEDALRDKSVSMDDIARVERTLDDALQDLRERGITAQQQRGSWRCDTDSMHSFADECGPSSSEEEADVNHNDKRDSKEVQGQVVRQENEGARAHPVTTAPPTIDGAPGGRRCSMSYMHSFANECTDDCAEEVDGPGAHAIASAAPSSKDIDAEMYSTTTTRRGSATRSGSAPSVIAASSAISPAALESFERRLRRKSDMGSEASSRRGSSWTLNSNDSTNEINTEEGGGSVNTEKMHSNTDAGKEQERRRSSVLSSLGGGSSHAIVEEGQESEDELRDKEEEEEEEEGESELEEAKEEVHENKNEERELNLGPVFSAVYQWPTTSMTTTDRPSSSSNEYYDPDRMEKEGNTAGMGRCASHQSCLQAEELFGAEGEAAAAIEDENAARLDMDGAGDHNNGARDGAGDNEVIAVGVNPTPVGAFYFPTPVRAAVGTASSAGVAARDRGESSSEESSSDDEDNPPGGYHSHQHAVHDAHVAPSSTLRSSTSWHDIVRERLVRNAPLVDATVVDSFSDNGGDHCDEENGENGGGGRRSSSIEQAPPRRISNNRSLPGSLSSDAESTTKTTGNSTGFWRRRTRRRCAATALLIFVAATALVLGVSIPLSRRSSGDDNGTDAEEELVGSDIPEKNATTHTPTLAPTLPPTSSAPTLASVSERFLLLKEIVSTVSTEADLTNPASPQYKALSWLADDDVMNLSAAEDPEKVIQRYIAATYYFTTGDVPDADFLEDIMMGDECTWNRPKSSTSWGMPKGVVCSESGHIISINFGIYFRPIEGTIPEEVGYLPRLQHLILSRSPDLVGTLPNTISELKDLRRVIMGRQEGLTGTIPSMNSPNMREILIGISPLTGTIPSSIGNMSKLVTLIIADTDITGTVPEFVADLKQLTILNMAENRHTGSIPASLGRNQNDLVLVNFGNNMINGTIPSGLLERDNMRGLFLHGNQLTGTVGSEFGNMVDLKRLVLYSNSLSSMIPPELGYSASLEYLELGDNLFTGVVPPSLGNLLNLESISLKGNPGLHGDLNYFCDKAIANFFTDCALSNPNLECECCECCSESNHTCGLYPDGRILFQNFLRTECCNSKFSAELQCGKDDCTGDV